MVSNAVAEVLLVFLTCYHVFPISTQPNENQCGPRVSVEDFKQHAQESLDQKAYRYIDLSAGFGDTRKWNRDAFRRIRFRSRPLTGVSKWKLSTKILGETISFPLGACPAAAQKAAHYKGELATAKAFSSMGLPMIVSVYSTVSMEDIADAGGPKFVRWQHIEIFMNRSVTLDLIRRAENVRAKALVVTIDDPVLGIRYNAYKDNFYYPVGARYANFEKYNTSDPEVNVAASWKDLEWIRDNTHLPLVVKGILTGEDAMRAVNIGAKGIIVSNHGARQLDGNPATIDVLPEVVQAVQGRAEVYLDSGVRTGMDMVKVLALGARAVFVGRPIFYGLSYQGEIGLKCVLNIFKSELENVLTLTGESDASNVSSSIIRKPSYCERDF